MKPAIWIAALALFVPTAADAVSLSPGKAQRVMARAVDDFIRPAYADFHEKSASLAAETEKLCAAPSFEQLQTVQARFSDVIASWGRAEIVRLGPVMEENRLERVLFYPDRKSTGLKQVQALLAAPDESVLDPATFRTRSVAMQGLGAFEYTFYGDYPEGLVAEKESFRCRYGLVVARNIQTIAGELQAAWDAPDGVANDWKNPSVTNPVFRTKKEAVTALVGIAVHGVEMVRDQRLGHFYKGRDAKVTPKQALLWRSGLTMMALSANVEGLSDFWKAARISALMDEDSRSLADAVTFDLDAAAKALKGLKQPDAAQLADPKYLAKLDFVEFNLKDAVTRIDTDIGAAMGLGGSFSFGDGD